ncbi:unnamed protein product [Sphagnum jensenii]|uniref:Endoplasmic reticulum-based factor for assembly of V-ATPase-domain-containing protein n=1 Tax=Sphagnum jensenii TaxID=128206 RepID=A0ABP1BJQ5_9BRYO
MSSSKEHVARESLQQQDSAVDNKGLLLRTSLNIKALLATAAANESLPIVTPVLHHAAVKFLNADVVPYPIVRDLWLHLSSGYGVPFHQVLKGSSFVLQSPKPRERSKELQERLMKLQEIADQKAYKELVKDITQHDHDEERVYFSSYREQLGFGLHVVLIMFTGYIFGYTIFRSQFRNSPALHAAGGALGLVAGMFLETILFITRSSIVEKNAKAKARSKHKKKPVSVPVQEVPVEDISSFDVQTDSGPALGARKRHGRTVTSD